MNHKVQNKVLDEMQLSRKKTNKIIRITRIGRKNDRQQQNLSVEIIDKEQM